MKNETKYVENLLLHQAEGNIRKKLFVDTSDVVGMILGWEELYKAGVGNFSPSIFFSQRFFCQMLFFFDTLKLDLNLLPPHQNELLKLINSNFSTELGNSMEDILSNLIDDTGLTKGEGKAYSEMSDVEKDNFLKNETAEGKDRFSAVNAIYPFQWKSRMNKIFIQEKIVKVDEKKTGLAGVFNSSIYTRLLDAANDLRNEPYLRRNNHHDALSMYFLHKELKQYKKEKKEPVLPIFYDPSPSGFFVKLIRKAGLQAEFSDHRTRELVVRRSEYFIIQSVIAARTVINLEERSMNSESELLNLYDRLEQIVSTHQVDLKHERRIEDLNKVIHKYINHQFLKEVMESVYKDVHFSNFFQLLKIEQKNFQNAEFVTSLDNGLDNIRKKMTITLNRFSQEMKLWSRIYEASKELHFDIDKREVTLGVTGLIRFSFTENVDYDFEELFDLEVFNNRNQNNNVNSAAHIFNLVISARENGDKDYYTLQLACGFLWLLGLHREIVKLLESNWREDLSLTILYGSAHGRLGNLRRVKTTIDELTWQLDNYNDSVGSINVGLAFLYYRLWEREDNVFKASVDCSEPIPNEYAELAIYHAEKAYKHLNSVQNKSDEQHNFFMLRLYALNLLCFYTVEIGTKQRYDDNLKYFNHFQEEKNTSIEYWVYRFDDTLARISHRSSFYSDEKLPRLQRSLELIQNSMENAAKKDFSDNYQDILIREIQKEKKLKNG